MARITKPLSDAEIKKAKILDKNYKLYDGDGLILFIAKSGSKTWRVNFTRDGKETTKTIGKYPLISLANARTQAYNIKNNILEESAAPVIKKTNSFNSVADKFLDFKMQELSFDYYKKQKRRLELYVYDQIGSKDIDAITKSDIVALIANVQHVKTQSSKSTNKAETARIVFNLVEQVFKWSWHNDLTTNTIISTIDRSLLIPKKEVVHFKAITDITEIRKLFKMIKEYQGELSTRSALLFLALTGLRSANVRGLKWEYVDLQKNIILFPSEAMKTKQSFRIPLTRELIDIINGMREFTGDKEYVFCSMLSKNKPLSENTLGYALKRMEVSNHTPHGFRSSFSTLAHEHYKEHGFSSEVIESQLAHAVGGKVKLSYLRSDFLEDRLELMKWWSEFLQR